MLLNFNYLTFEYKAHIPLLINKFAHINWPLQLINQLQATWITFRYFDNCFKFSQL